MSQPATTSGTDYKGRAIRRRNRYGTVAVILGLTLVCFSYYFYQVFFTANIETQGKPTYVLIPRCQLEGCT